MTLPRPSTVLLALAVLIGIVGAVVVLRSDSPDGALRELRVNIEQTNPDTRAAIERTIVARLSDAGAEGIEVDFNAGGADVQWRSDEVTLQRGRRLITTQGALEVRPIRSFTATYEPQLAPFDGPPLIASASLQAVDEQAAADWQVRAELTADGLTYMDQLASACFNHTAPCESGQAALVLDGEILSQPAFADPRASLTALTVRFQGSDSEVETSDLAAVLNSGPLPVDLTTA